MAGKFVRYDKVVQITPEPIRGQVKRRMINDDDEDVYEVEWTDVDKNVHQRFFSAAELEMDKKA